MIFLSPGGRGATAPLPFLDASCRDLTAGAEVDAVASSQQGSHVAREAIDGHRGSMWNAGGPPPAWWCADLGAVQPVRGVTVVPAMRPAIAKVAHVIETCTAGEDWAVQVDIAQAMTDGAVYAFPFPGGVEARWVRIRTTSSPCAVAWYEIGIFG
jgi:hypothetical protein